MAIEPHRECNRMPSWVIILLMVLLQQKGVLPKAHSPWLWSSISKIQGLPTTLGTRICDENSLVEKQRIMCQKDPKIMLSVGEGAFNGICECKHQFRNERWNCSTLEKGLPVLGKVINPGSREASFVHAITAAGVMYSVTKACSRGDLLSCSCDRDKHGEDFDENDDYHFTWGGCSDDIDNGSYFVKEFVDAHELDGHDARAQMNLHNNRAGRRAIRKFKKRQCKCHGATGSCELRTCWDAMSDFRETGDYLKNRYDNAIEVTVQQNEFRGQLVSKARGNEPNKNDLVFLESSPDYCEHNPKLGIFGTEGRECNAESAGNDGCEKLCCGRGYYTKSVTRMEDCKCKFHWCCEVRCQKCPQKINIHTCKGPGSEEAAVSAAPTASAMTATSRSRRKPGSGRRRKGGKGNKKRKGGRRKGGGRSSKRRNKRDIHDVIDDEQLRHSDIIEWESVKVRRRRLLKRSHDSFVAATVTR